MRSVEVVSLVYRSPAYARFVSEQLARHREAPGWDVRLRVVANDPEVDDAVLLDAPRRLGIKADVYHDPDPGAHYIARVYRCYNWAVKTSKAEYVCLVNSDMAFSEGWLEALLRLATSERVIPTSRLVESGKMPSGQHAVSLNMGRTPETFDQAAWDLYVEQSRQARHVQGGLFMPAVFSRAAFLEAGGYPEGNVYRDGIGTLNGRVVCSGDRHFFDLMANERWKHVTAFDSLVYHFQEGERDS